MTTMLYAQPYNIDSTGFSFTSAEEYRTKAEGLTDRFGQPVDEFEIQFLDGEAIDAALVDAVGLHQGDISAFFEKIGEWDDHGKRVLIIAAGECGYDFNWQSTEAHDFDFDIYELESLRKLAEHFVDGGLFGEISERFQFYIDLDAIARDLGCDYAETAIVGTRLVYRCG